MAFPKMFAIGAALALASCSGGKSGAPDIGVSGAWARGTVPGQTAAAAYFEITNNGNAADTLVGVSSAIGDATMHSSSMEGGIMRMRPLQSVDLPAHSVVKFQPGGNHIMITGLKRPLGEHDSFALSLHFQLSGDRDVTVEVRPATATGMAM